MSLAACVYQEAHVSNSYLFFLFLFFTLSLSLQLRVELKPHTRPPESVNAACLPAYLGPRPQPALGITVIRSLAMQPPKPATKDRPKRRS